ncbi:hypothetical protein AAZX31_12G166100 [Glycine max]
MMHPSSTLILILSIYISSFIPKRFNRQKHNSREIKFPIGSPKYPRNLFCHRGNIRTYVDEGED